MSPYKVARRKGSRKTFSAHTIIVEDAIGHKLPELAEVHHVDKNKHNNTATNLVVCPDHSYHMMLHRRQKALEECGNANWFKCHICKAWDAPENLNILLRASRNGVMSWHRECDNKRARLLRKRKAQDVANMVAE